MVLLQQPDAPQHSRQTSKCYDFATFITINPKTPWLISSQPAKGKENRELAGIIMLGYRTEFFLSASRSPSHACTPSRRRILRRRCPRLGCGPHHSLKELPSPPTPRAASERPLSNTLETDASHPDTLVTDARLACVLPLASKPHLPLPTSISPLKSVLGSETPARVREPHSLLDSGELACPRGNQKMATPQPLSPRSLGAGDRGCEALARIFHWKPVTP